MGYYPVFKILDLRFLKEVLKCIEKYEGWEEIF